jgi:hypothetical protein
MRNFSSHQPITACLEAGGQPVGDRPIHPAAVENVIYRHNPDYNPAIQYHSTPSSCSGGANTMGEARSSYRSDLAARLSVTRRELPSVVEHLEGLVAGIWVRTRVGTVYRERTSDRMFLQTLLSAGVEQDALRADLDLATRAGAAPVVLIVEPDDTVGTILDQMRPDDALWVTYSDPRNIVGWLGIYGPAAPGVDHIPTDHVDEADVHNTSVETFAQTYATCEHRAVRLRSTTQPTRAALPQRATSQHGG